MQVVHLLSASSFRSKATLVRADALVPFRLDSFEANNTKHICSDEYQANTSINEAYSIALFLEKIMKNGLTPVVRGSLIQLHFADNPMQPRDQGVKARLINRD